jgi:hypothetical protein
MTITLLDPKSVDGFCDFCEYTKTEFWEIIDGFYNREIFKKNKMGKWVLKMPAWKESQGDVCN